MFHGQRKTHTQDCVGMVGMFCKEQGAMSATQRGENTRDQKDNKDPNVLRHYHGFDICLGKNRDEAGGLFKYWNDVTKIST